MKLLTETELAAIQDVIATYKTSSEVDSYEALYTYLASLLADLRHLRRRLEAAERIAGHSASQAGCSCYTCWAYGHWRAIVEECEDSWGFDKEITLVMQSDGLSHEEATRIVHGRAQRLVEAIFPELKAKEERRRCVLCGNTNCADVYEDEELGQ